MSDEPSPQSEIILCQTDDASMRLEVRLQDETVLPTPKLMPELVGKDVRTVNEHILNIFKEGELADDSVVRKFRITADDDKSHTTQHHTIFSIQYPRQ